MAGGRKNQIRIYADTSVFGGVFDEEFADASRSFFEAVEKAKFGLVTSEVVREEISAAPERVREYFGEMLAYCQVAEVRAETLQLQDAYIKEGIVSADYAADALHVALATVSGAKMIVSWNFKHIVNFKKIPLYNAVNKLKGYEPIEIYSPLEVVQDED